MYGLVFIPFKLYHYGWRQVGPPVIRSGDRGPAELCGSDIDGWDIMIVNVKLKVFLGALMIRSLRVFEISFNYMYDMWKQQCRKTYIRPCFESVTLHWYLRCILRGHGKVQMNSQMIRSDIEIWYQSECRTLGDIFKYDCVPNFIVLLKTL